MRPSIQAGEGGSIPRPRLFGLENAASQASRDRRIHVRRGGSGSIRTRGRATGLSSIDGSPASIRQNIRGGLPSADSSGSENSTAETRNALVR